MLWEYGTPFCPPSEFWDDPVNPVYFHYISTLALSFLLNLLFNWLDVNMSSATLKQNQTNQLRKPESRKKKKIVLDSWESDLVD